MKKILLFSFSFFLVATQARAQSPGTVLVNDTGVHEQASTSSDILITLEKGKAVSVLGTKPGWLQVKVQLDKSFSFTGWVPEKTIRWRGTQVAKKPSAPVRKVVPQTLPPPMPVPVIPPVMAVAPQPVPTPVPQRATPNSELDQFFTPVQSAPASATSANDRSQVVPVMPTTSKLFTPHKLASSEKAEISAGLGYLLYHYSLSTGGTSPAKLFAYNLPGLGVQVDSKYWFYEKMNGALRVGGSLYLQYGFYQFDTQLQDNTGTTFNTVKTNSSAIDAILKMPVEYRIGTENLPIYIGGSIGAGYFHFFADDISNDAGPMALYVSQTNISAIAGLQVRAAIPQVPNLLVNVVADVLPYTLVRESPKGITGASPKGKIGYAPSLIFSWAPTEQHQLDLGYRLKLQKFGFSGTGSRIGSANITDGKVSTAAHTFFVQYDYRFK